mmetsp:Transcript_51931/g.110358  ORF Transcript_51931/g.110358 Transcript_51931/m.110358 type:complete len:211 (-) Transcript_51931:879-1511(-)
MTTAMVQQRAGRGPAQYPRQPNRSTSTARVRKKRRPNRRVHLLTLLPFWGPSSPIIPTLAAPKSQSPTPARPSWPPTTTPTPASGGENPHFPTESPRKSRKNLPFDAASPRSGLCRGPCHLIGDRLSWGRWWGRKPGSRSSSINSSSCNSNNNNNNNINIKIRPRLCPRQVPPRGIMLPWRRHSRGDRICQVRSRLGDVGSATWEHRAQM